MNKNTYISIRTKIISIVCVVGGLTSVLAACQGNLQDKDGTGKTLTHRTDAATAQVSDVTLDEIITCETILEDSSLLDAGGAQAWSVNSDGTLTVRDGERFYHRIITTDGNSTDVTYKRIN